MKQQKTLTELLTNAPRVFLVPHNVRQEVPVHVAETDLTIGVDAVGGDNEDPYVWAPNFLYTFCHAHGNRYQGSLLEDVPVGSVIIFLALPAPEKGRPSWKNATHVQIDTVMTVQAQVKWQLDNPPLTLAALQQQFQEAPAYLGDGQAIENHLPYIDTPTRRLLSKNPGHDWPVHNDWQSYVTLVGDPENSFLPLGADKHIVDIQGDLAKALINYIQINKRNRAAVLDLPELVALQPAKGARVYFRRTERVLADGTTNPLWAEMIDPLVQAIDDQLAYRVTGSELVDQRP
ncbi:hypothetical protein [Levilactobacillus lindianensis]|uniref:hypothetical protein n=1 Tax=Levilactobacillus lindianensis TaxID=2486018 RepID=UPI000F73896C|nr:hypothetical protein [Levilactobacillus lindianensis]